MREYARIAGDVDEQLLLQYAEALSAAQLEASIRTFRRTRKDRLEAEQLRTASWSASHDGTVTLRAVLPAEEGARVIAALEKALDYLNSPSHAPAGPSAPAGTLDGAAEPGRCCANTRPRRGPGRCGANTRRRGGPGALLREHPTTLPTRPALRQEHRSRPQQDPARTLKPNHRSPSR